MKVLFVCGGNTCRSPMAAAIAQHLLGPSLDAESAGIVPHGDSATSDAVAVVRDLFGIDISSHRPKEVAPDSLATSDYIVALDSYVTNRLREDFGVTSSQLIQWEVKDPYLSGREGYERCAREIETNVRELKRRFGKPERPARQAESTARKPQFPSLRELIRDLRQNLERWKDEVSGGIVRGTTLHGIADKAVDNFQVIFLETARAYRALAGIESSAGKPFKRWTFGELIHFFCQHNKELTTAARQTPDGADLFKNRTVVSPMIRDFLDSISVRRNVLHHPDPQEFAPDNETLQMNTEDLLNVLSKALADPLFDYAAVQERPA